MGAKRFSAVVQSPKYSPKTYPKQVSSLPEIAFLVFNNSAETLGPFLVNAHWHSNNSFLSLLVVNHLSSAFW